MAVLGLTTSAPHTSSSPVGLPGPPAASVSDLFTSGVGNPWTTPIAPDAAVDPRSESYVRGFTRSPLVISHKLWTVPVYRADAATPRADVPLTAEWAPARVLYDMPIPEGARPDPAGDAHLVVIDPARGCVYELWKARRTAHGWTAAWGNAIPSAGNGVYPNGLSARASGLSAAAGLVTPEELRRGVIDHALVFAYPYTRSGGPVAPATGSDGRSRAGFALPEGARVQLDPSLDLAALGLDGYELTIARALQRYGMILGDTSGGFTIYSVHPQSQPADAYDSLLPNESWIDLGKIPTDRFRVLRLRPQHEHREAPHLNGCARHG